MQAGATLRDGDLKRNGVASVEAIYDLVYNGRGKMPGYGTGCTPKVMFASHHSQGAQVPDAVDCLAYLSRMLARWEQIASEAFFN